jgi:hypothetical protein
VVREVPRALNAVQMVVILYLVPLLLLLAVAAELRRAHILAQEAVQAAAVRGQEQLLVRELPVKDLQVAQVLVHRFTAAAVVVLQQLARRHRG